MKFNKIQIPESLTKTKGIEEINIQRLGNVVAFVGKNGSGKSRILDLIEDHLFSSITFARIIDGSISHMPASLESLKMQVKPFQEYFILEDKEREIAKEIGIKSSDKLIMEHKSIENRKQAYYSVTPHQQIQINSLSGNLQKHTALLKVNNLRRINNKQIGELQQVFNQTQSNPAKSFESLFENQTANDNYNELELIYQNALKFMSELPHDLAGDKYDSIVEENKIEDRISHKRFLSLQRLIKDFLNKELIWEQVKSSRKKTEAGNNVLFTGKWKLDGRDFKYGDFSDGEKYLFAYALLFFLLEQNPKLNIKESIILIDEPELHLHPDSEIDLINGLRKAIGEKGQLIIATHSINILSHLNYEEIFMVKENTIKYPTQSTPRESLAQLMGINDRIDKLSSFLTSISSWTFANYMAQCFNDPEVIESAKPNDPQIEALKKAIIDHSTKSSNILLDFGAGKGRLFEQVKADYKFIDKISYSALEIEEKFHPRLKELGANNIYKNHSSLPENTFDFIVLCNVLHEIEINEWVETINSIIKALKQTGYLIIIEAKTLTKGEKIGKIGYMLLDIEEMQELFNLKTPLSPINIKGGEEKITCVAFLKSDLNTISISNLENCFTLLEINTLKKIEKLRKDAVEAPVDKVVAFGRESVYLSQQNINAKLALKYLKTEYISHLN